MDFKQIGYAIVCLRIGSVTVMKVITKIYYFHFADLLFSEFCCVIHYPDMRNFVFNLRKGCSRICENGCHQGEHVYEYSLDLQTPSISWVSLSGPFIFHLYFHFSFQTLNPCSSIDMRDAMFNVCIVKDRSCLEEHLSGILRRVVW
jgi:hypothetical protein